MFSFSVWCFIFSNCFLVVCAIATCIIVRKWKLNWLKIIRICNDASLNYPSPMTHALFIDLAHYYRQHHQTLSFQLSSVPPLRSLLHREIKEAKLQTLYSAEKVLTCPCDHLITLLTALTLFCCRSPRIKEGSQVHRLPQQLHLPTIGIWDAGHTQFLHYGLFDRTWSSAFCIQWRTAWDCLSFSAFVCRCSNFQRRSDPRNLLFIQQPIRPLSCYSFLGCPER